MIVVVACCACVLAGCGTNAPERDPPATEPPAANQALLTLYIEGMTEKQGITWPTWRNAVEEALSGLAGVEKVVADLKKDRLTIHYDPNTTTKEQMLEAIDKLGFPGKVMAETGAAKAPWAETDLCVLCCDGCSDDRRRSDRRRSSPVQASRRRRTLSFMFPACTDRPADRTGCGPHSALCRA
jgi:copper chaperone CopZ